MHRPTKKYNILDLIFCPSELINTISVSDTFISDHRTITVEKNIPVHCVAPKDIQSACVSSRGAQSTELVWILDFKQILLLLLLICPLIILLILVFTKLNGPIFCRHYNLLNGWSLLSQFHHLLVLTILLTLRLLPLIMTLVSSAYIMVYNNSETLHISIM